jgi:arsenate reductase
VITIYGIRNCDKIKRTLAWFDEQGVAVRFHDYRKDGLDEAALKAWTKTLDWSSLINRAGTTWRALPEDVKQGVTSAKAAHSLMLTHPALIKRPLIVSGNAVHIGYDEAVFAGLAGVQHAT